MRSTNGTAYGATLLGNTRLGTGVLATNLIGYGGLMLNSGTAEFGLNPINAGVFSGDGSGLSNLLFVASAGSVGSPSFRFSNDADTGLYSAGSGGEFSVSINGVQSWVFGNGAGGRMFRPNTDNAYDIGTASLRPANIYGVNFIGGTYFGTFVGDGASLTNLSGSITPLTNLFVLGTRYTNANQRAFISQCFTLNGAAAGAASVTLSVEQGNGVTNRAQISAGPLASLSTTEQLSMIVSPQAIYTFLDTTSGTGATVSAITNTATWIGL